MENNELYHHGIMGMRWGVRRTPAQLGYKKAPAKKKSLFEKKKKPTAKSKSSASASTASKKTTKEMTDAELRDAIARLQLEKQFKELTKGDSAPKVNRGKVFVMGILESSGKNIATQLGTYVLGTAVNKLVGQEIVNPKKGQKDK